MIGNTSSVFKIHLPFLFPFFHQVRIRITSISINKITITTYLIFVIFLHMQNFWRIKFTPKYTVNYCVLLCITVYYCVLHSKYTVNCQFFRLWGLSGWRTLGIPQEEPESLRPPVDWRSRRKRKKLGAQSFDNICTRETSPWIRN